MKPAAPVTKTRGHRPRVEVIPVSVAKDATRRKHKNSVVRQADGKQIILV
jgi:hypothetical protein